jgi:hypothetical protein
VLLVASTAAAQTSPARPGVPPQGMSYPVSHPIKGNFTTYSGEPCIYHVRGGQFYDRTKPECCYAGNPGENAGRRAAPVWRQGRPLSRVGAAEPLAR